MIEDIDFYKYELKDKERFEEFAQNFGEQSNKRLVLEYKIDDLCAFEIEVCKRYYFMRGQQPQGRMGHRFAFIKKMTFYFVYLFDWKMKCIEPEMTQFSPIISKHKILLRYP